MAPFTKEQVDLIEQLIVAVMRSESRGGDCADALAVHRIKKEMVADPFLAALADNYKE